MALFAFWRDADVADPATAARRAIAAAHLPAGDAIERTCGDWRLVALAPPTAYLSAAQQVWSDGAQACIVHGLPWRLVDGAATVVDAAAMAALVDRPDAPPPAGLGGEYAVVRLLACGTLLAFGDPAGLHQIFRHRDRPGIVSSRAGIVAALANEGPRADPAIPAIGYRIGTATGWHGVVQLAQGRTLVVPPAGGTAQRLAPSPVAAGPRGLSPVLLDEGIAEAVAAIRLAAARGPLPLGITGGKDSRAVLALALAAGVGERLDLFTRGPEGHPDVAAGRRLAEAAGLPHRREPPLGDGDTDWTVDRFAREMAALAFQTDGAMGGWDRATAGHAGTGTMLSGHLGEVLKAYAKHPPADPADPVAMVRGQAPFDPLGLLRPEARARLTAEIAGQMAAGRGAGATDGDLGDLFYHRNRVPNWLGGLRGTKGHEAQPVLPLGVPALQRLAFAMTAEERRMEAAHHAIVRRCAPQLLSIPFAHQAWHPSLGEAAVAPLLAPAGMALFGSWQFSINRNPAVRLFLDRLFATIDLPLWADIDRGAVAHHLRHRRFDYFDGISLMGLTVVALHVAGLTPAARIGDDRPDLPAGLAALIPDAPVRIDGHVDIRDGRHVAGWLWAPEWPGASPLVEARDHDGNLLARTAGERPRPDLAAAGIGDGRYGFAMDVPGDAPFVLTGFGGTAFPA